MSRATWIGRSPAWRALALVAGLVIVGSAWYLGSPLFIRTTVHEDLPVASAAAAATTAATAAATSLATSAPATVAPTTAGPVILAQGQLQFVDSIHNGKGPVRLVRIGEQRLLRFDEVAITNAP